MRKMLVSLIAALGLLFVPTAALAAGNDVNNSFCSTGGGNTAFCKDVHASTGSNPLLGPSGLLTTVVKILSFIVGFAALVVIILSGVRYILSNGDSAKVSQAKNSLIYAVIGLVVAILAQVIVSFVISKV